MHGRRRHDDHGGDRYRLVEDADSPGHMIRHRVEDGWNEGPYEEATPSSSRSLGHTMGRRLSANTLALGGVDDAGSDDDLEVTEVPPCDEASLNICDGRRPTGRRRLQVFEAAGRDRPSRVRRGSLRSRAASPPSSRLVFSPDERTSRPTCERAHGYAGEAISRAARCSRWLQGEQRDIIGAAKWRVATVRRRRTTPGWSHSHAYPERRARGRNCTA